MIGIRKRPWRRILPRNEVAPLRCAFIITSMPVGGAETLLVNMMRRMDRTEMLPEVICLKARGPLGEQIADEFTVHSNLLSTKWDLRVLPRLVSLLRKRNIDVVVTVAAGDNMFWGRLAAHLAGVPVIAAALHSTGWPDGVGRLNRMLTPFTDAFVAVADSHGEFLHDFEQFPKSKIRVIRNGVDCDRFAPSANARQLVRDELGLPASAPLIGIVAALRNEKNHGMFVRGAKALAGKYPDAHWIIVGDGPERPAIESLARQLQIEDRIHLLGMRHDTPQLVAALDVFTLCSLNEAFPVSILEALACEVPVVATDVGSVCESIVDGKTGFLVPSEDNQAFAAAIDRLLGDRSLRQRLGAAGRARVARSSSLDSMVNGYVRMAQELYDNRVPAGSSSHPLRPVPSAASQTGTSQVKSQT